MKETGLTGKRRSTTIAATPDDGNSQRKRRRRRSERAADFWRTDRRLVVAERMLHDILGPGFSETSPESRRRSDSLRDGL